MNILFLLAGIGSLVAAWFAGKAAWASRGKRPSVIQYFLSGLMLANLATGLVQVFWGIVQGPSGVEVLLTYQLFLGMQTALLVATMACLVSRKMVWLLGLYIFTVPVLVLPGTDRIILWIFASSLVQLAFFAVAALKESREVRDAGIIGVIATIVVITALLTANMSLMLSLGVLVSTLLYALAYRKIGKHMINAGPTLHFKSNVSSFLRFIILVPVITMFLLFVTISVHELGHAVAGDVSGCSFSQAVIYEIGGSAHANVQCDNNTDKAFVGLAGPLLPLILALVFVFIAQEFTTILALYLSGYGLIFFYGDLSIIGAPPAFSFVTTLLGFGLLIFAIVRLTLFFLRDR
ncbi:MAG: hypothetical protein ABIA93_05460 [Candidatus Woesearchaeota archaeon]